MSIIENNKQQANNSQRNAYQLTINNPLDYGFDHLTIKKTLVHRTCTWKYTKQYFLHKENWKVGGNRQSRNESRWHI